MIRRVVAAAVWAYLAWYAAGMFATMTGGPEIAGPIAAAMVIALDIGGGARASRSRRVEVERAVEGTR